MKKSFVLNVGIGTTNAVEKLTVAGDSWTGSVVAAYGDAVYPYMNLRRYKGSMASPTQPGNGDILGSLAFQGYGDYVSAEIVTQAAETITGSANGGHLILLTTATGASSQTERMRITSQGLVGIGTATPGAKLDVYGQVRTKSHSTTSGAIDWDNGNAQTTSFNCATDITFANLLDGASYTLVVTDGGTTQCNFSTTTTGTDAATVNYRFNPAPGARTGSSHTVYSLQRVGDTVYVSWITGF